MWLKEQTAKIHASARIWPEMPRIKTRERPLVFAKLPNGSATRRATFESQLARRSRLVAA